MQQVKMLVKISVVGVLQLQLVKIEFVLMHPIQLIQKKVVEVGSRLVLLD